MTDTVDSRVTDGAALLRDAEHGRQPVGPLSERFPGLTLEQAYGIQRLNIDQRLAAGETIAGHKIGLTARAMQELFGVDEPDYGHLLSSMMHPAHLSLDLGELIDPQIEVEPAFLLGRRLAGPGVTAQQVMEATECVMVCFEVIDSRIADWRIKLEDTVADNGSSARVVLGAARATPSVLIDKGLRTVLEVDGQVVETGSTDAILGHPAHGVAWLANALAGFGGTLEAGHLVLPGTCTRSYRMAGHASARGIIEGLGEVRLELTGQPTVGPR